MSKLSLLLTMFTVAACATDSDDKLDLIQIDDVGELPEVSSDQGLAFRNDNQLFAIKTDGKITRVLEVKRGAAVDIIPSTQLELCEQLPSDGACALACDPTFVERMSCKLSTGGTLHILGARPAVTPGQVHQLSGSRGVIMPGQVHQLSGTTATSPSPTVDRI